MQGRGIANVGQCGGIKLNNFHNDLEYSMELRDDERLDDFYKAAFPMLERIEFCSEISMQQKGIDKIIYFSNGNAISIDEKKRRKDYGDILLEIWKNKEQKKPGWLFYSQCDYIVYAILGANKIYLLPVLLLQMAWKNNGKEWLGKYDLKIANNGSYDTVNIAIPTDVLLNAISNEMKKQTA